MANSQVRLGKPTLDKDLEKLTFTEQATHFVLRSWTGVGISLVFLLITMTVAGSFATGAASGLPRTLSKRGPAAATSLPVADATGGLPSSQASNTLRAIGAAVELP